MDFFPSTLEVDYDKNLTELYKAITDQDWDRAVDICKRDPEQAKTWVVRHYEDGEEEGNGDDIMWRFLPLHSACARQPPISVVASLLRAYPDGAKCQDDQGMYALHYACGNQAARDVARILLVSYPEAAKKRDPRGMLPIHYLACWGPSSVSVVDMLLVANPDVGSSKDSEGKTPLDLAREGEYPEKKSVIAVLQKWFSDHMSISDRESGSAGPSKRSGQMSRSGSFSSPKATSRSYRSDLKSSTSKMRSSSRHLEEEEKKEEDESSYMMSPRRSYSEPKIEDPNLTSLKEEIEVLKTEKAAMQKKLDEANRKCELQEEEIIDMQDELAEAKMSRSRGHQDQEDTQQELERTKNKLRGCTDELKGLRMTMVDMMEEHDNLKQKNTNTVGRLASLSVSLEGLMSQQRDLAKIIRSSASKRKESYKTRKENMRALLEMEEVNEEDDDALEGKLKKQSKEMEALQAMIEAARD